MSQESKFMDHLTDFIRAKIIGIEVIDELKETFKLRMLGPNLYQYFQIWENELQPLTVKLFYIKGILIYSKFQVF